MTTQEFSNQFDVLYNNITSNQAPGIDEYEKSIFLTKAQEELVRDYFSARTVKNAQGFDDSQKRQYDFSTLLSTVSLPDYTNTLEVLNSLGIVTHDYSFDNRSKIYIAPSDLFLAINEIIVDDTNRRYSVLPISYEEYNRLMLKPYGYPLKRQAWRIISDRTSSLVGWGGIILKNETETNSNKILFKSKSSKTLHIRIITLDSYLDTAPIIKEDESYVTINIIVGAKSIKNFYETYLKDAEALKTAGLTDYIYPLDNNKTGYFPTENLVVQGSNKFSEIIISPAVLNPAVLEDNSISNLTPIFEIIGRFNGNIKYYNLRYVRTPKPIILDDLEDIQEGLSINGYDKVTQCELPVNTHQEILQRAVELAKASYQGDLSSIIQTGNASGTDIGYVSNHN